MALFLPDQKFLLDLQINKKNLGILLQCDNFIRIFQYYSIGSRGDPLLTMIIVSNVESRLVECQFVEHVK